MPLFGHDTGDSDTTTWEPQSAEGRLAHTSGADPAGVFTSKLSTGEYILLVEAGYEPLGFVMGSSMYHIGFQPSRWSKNQELTVLTQAMYNARELAMSRMEAEAAHLGADGVVGVGGSWQRYAWGADSLEFLATGTAVKAIDGASPRRTPSGEPFIAALNVQSFFRLLAVGKMPVSFAFGSCVYHVAHQSVTQTLRQTGQNQEVAQFTQGIYDARELALSRMQAEATEEQASGIVNIGVTVSSHVWGEHATEFFASGVSVRSLSEEERLPETSLKPTFTLDL